MKRPSFHLPGEMINAIRKDSGEAEKQGYLTAEQLLLIFRQKWFHLFVPEAYGGLNLSLPEAVRLEESIAYADGSMGWVVTLCAGAAMFIGYFEEDLAREVFADPHVCLAGSGQATGTAKIIDSGFEITGTWLYSSGAAHATHFTANCVIEEQGKSITGVDGQPLIRSFIFARKEVTLRHNWDYLGLNATSGHAYSVEKLKVPANRTFIIDPAQTRLPQPVYRYPFLQFAETTIAANQCGMCLYFLDLAKELLLEKQNKHTGDEAAETKGLQLLSQAASEIQLLRKQFYEVLDDSWNSHRLYNHIEAHTLFAVSENALRLAHQARNWVNLIYPYCGLTAARTGTAINQVWRNINTASQHSLLNRILP